MIQIDDLAFDYGNQSFQLEIPSMEIRPGEKVALVGQSGSGKSTLLKLLSGIVTPSAGSVRVNQLPVHQMSDSERRRFRSSQLGIVFQELELIEHLTVRDNIRLPYLISGFLKWTRRSDETLFSLASACGIESLLNRYPRQLSQGERQRVSVCRALITKPQLILADEPTGSLDTKTGANVLALLVSQAEELSSTLLMVTHDLSFAAQLDRVITMADFQGNLTRPEDAN